MAALSRDRRYVLTFGGDSAAAVWSSETGKKITSLGNWEWVDYACLSPDSRRAALVSRNGWAIVWDIASDREVRTLWHQGPVLHAVFRPDGKRLATVSTDRQARVWDVESGKSAAAPLWHEDTVNSVAFSPDGKRLVTTTANQIVRLWDFAAAPGITLPHRATVRSATFSPDGKRILTTTDSSAQLWETTSTVGKAKFVLAPGAQIYHASFSPDGAYVLTASEDRLARLWYVDTGKEITALRHPHRVRHAAFSRNGKMLLTASDRQLAVWDMAALPRAAEPKLILLHDDAVEYTRSSQRMAALFSASISAAPPGCGTSRPAGSGRKCAVKRFAWRGSVPMGGAWQPADAPCRFGTWQRAQPLAAPYKASTSSRLSPSRRTGDDCRPPTRGTCASGRHRPASPLRRPCCIRAASCTWRSVQMAHGY